MKIVVGIENPHWIHVNPETTGIGGSEESALYLQREMTALGHEFILTDKMDEPCDIFVSWRLAYLRNPNAKKRYLHCHDWPVNPHWQPDALEHFDKIIMLNEYHRAQYGVPEDRAFVCGNGVDMKQFDQQVERIPGKCLYFSHPHRGLHKLREYWPRIRAAVPNATLHAFWWEPEHFMPADESLGIMPMRNLGHEELAREILSSECLTYPSVFSPEINPITCIKSQVGGAIPLVVLQGGMGDTLLTKYFWPSDYEKFAEMVITFFKLPNSWDEYRSAMMREARERFDWRNISKKWEQEFLTELAK
jgi:glycosyltransferase involved in cell wall biosynthesis